jgi:alanine racemase
MASDPADRAGAILEIDLTGIAANWRLLAQRVAPASCAAVVKADAYGLGAAMVSAALAKEGCRLFFTATLDEAIALRSVLPPVCEISVFNGLPPHCAEEFVAYHLIPVLNHPGQIADWEEIAGCRNGLPAMLHLDTGMARLGLTGSEFDALADRSLQRGAIGWCGLISHLACADQAGHPLNKTQRLRFVAARERLGDLPASLAGSSAIFLGREFHFDFVRPGAALYGVNPCPNTPNPMHQIVRLRGRILQVREVDRGQSVGYGATHVMDAPGRLATVAVGYADGWLRSLSHRGSGSLGDRRVPLLGRVSMDLVVFDVSGIDPALARPGNFIDLIDGEYGVDAVAADAGTIGYEVLTSLGSRYHRVYRDASSPC